jgi:hypothetical protein
MLVAGGEAVPLHVAAALLPERLSLPVKLPVDGLFQRGAEVWAERADLGVQAQAEKPR